MESTDKLQIDLTNPEDIRAKLPEAKRLYRLKVDAANRAKRDAEQWGTLVASLAQFVGDDEVRPTVVGVGAIGSALTAGLKPAKRTTQKKASPAQDRAIAGLRRADRPMAPTPLYRFMVGENLPVPTNSNALGAALWNAVDAGRIKKTPDGLYALLEWDTDQPELQDASQNGSASRAAPPAGDQADPGTGVTPVTGDEQGVPPDVGPTSGPTSGSLTGEGSAEAASRF